MAKEKLYTIPLNDAVNAQDECPFCYIERNLEQDLMDFVLGSGSSYMEADIRDMTDNAGFCRTRQYPWKRVDPENPLYAHHKRDEEGILILFSDEIIAQGQDKRTCGQKQFSQRLG